MMMAPAHFPSSTEKYENIYFLWEVLPWFHMPLFIFMAGYLYSFQCARDKRKYSSGKYLVFTKAKRLLLPYFIFSFIYIIVFENNFDALHLLSGSVGHFWFIAMLFWCFVVMWCLNRFKMNSILSLSVLACSFALVLFPPFLPRWLGIHHITCWFFWFYLGYWVCRHAETCKRAISRYHIALLLPFIYAIGMSFQIKVYGRYCKTFFSEIGYLSAVMWLWYSANWLISRYGEKWAKCRFFVEISACSYGIYVFHNCLEPLMISNTAQKLLPLARLANDHVILFPLCFSLLALLFSYIATKILLLTKAGKFLIG